MLLDLQRDGLLGLRRIAELANGLERLLKRLGQSLLGLLDKHPLARSLLRLLGLLGEALLRLLDFLKGKSRLKLPAVVHLTDALLRLLNISELGEPLLGLLDIEPLTADALLRLLDISQGRHGLLRLLRESLYMLQFHDHCS